MFWNSSMNRIKRNNDQIKIMFHFCKSMLWKYSIYICYENQPNINSKAETKSSSRRRPCLGYIAIDYTYVIKGHSHLLLLAVFIIMSWGQNKHESFIYRFPFILLFILFNVSNVRFLFKNQYHHRNHNISSWMCMNLFICF